MPRLLPKKALVSTSDVDKAEWNFSHSSALDFGHYVLTGYRASEHHGNRRDLLLPTLLKTFVSEEELRAPRFLPRFFLVLSGVQASSALVRPAEGDLLITPHN